MNKPKFDLEIICLRTMLGDEAECSVSKEMTYDLDLMTFQSFINPEEAGSFIRNNIFRLSNGAYLQSCQRVGLEERYRGESVHFFVMVINNSKLSLVNCKIGLLVKESQGAVKLKEVEVPRMSVRQTGIFSTSIEFDESPREFTD